MTQSPGTPPGGDAPAAETPPPAAVSANPAVERVIERFGGIRPMAAKLDAPVTTVQGWKKRGAIPPVRHDDLRAAAVRHGVEIDEAELTAAGQHDDGRPEEPAAEETAAAEVAADAPKTEEVKAEEVKAAPEAAAAPQQAGAEPEVAPEIEIIRPAAAAPRVDLHAETSPRGVGLAATLSIAALAVAAAALTQPLWLGRAVNAPPPVAAAPAADPGLKAEIAALADKLAKLESRPAPATAAAAPTASEPDPRVADLSAQLGALKSDVGRVGEALAALAARPAGDASLSAASASAATAVLEGKLQALEARLDGVVRGKAEAAAKAPALSPALAVAAVRLRGAITDGRPFAAELKTTRDAAGGDGEIAKALDAAAPLAATGAPTLAALTARFAPLASEIVRAHNRGDAATWLDQVQGAVLTLVTVRPQGAVTGDSPAAVTARAETALAALRLPQAVDELSALQGPAAKAAAPWLAAARARLAAAAAAQTVVDRAVALSAGSTGEKTPADAKGVAQ